MQIVTKCFGSQGNQYWNDKISNNPHVRFNMQNTTTAGDLQIQEIYNMIKQFRLQYKTTNLGIRTNTTAAEYTIHGDKAAVKAIYDQLNQQQYSNIPILRISQLN